MTQMMELEGHVKIEWTNGDKDNEWYAWRVYKRNVATGAVGMIFETSIDQPTYEFRDYLARSGIAVEYAVVQVASRFGSPIESVYNWTAATPLTTDYWLLLGNEEDDWDSNRRLHHVTEDSVGDEWEETTHTLAGRGRQKEYGTYYGRSGSISAKLMDRPDSTARYQRLSIEELKARLVPLWLRTPFGDIWQVATGNLQFDREAGVGLREHGSLSFSYEEVDAIAGGPV